MQSSTSFSESPSTSARESFRLYPLRIPTPLCHPTSCVVAEVVTKWRTLVIGKILPLFPCGMNSAALSRVTSSDISTNAVSNRCLA